MLPPLLASRNLLLLALLAGCASLTQLSSAITANRRRLYCMSCHIVSGDTTQLDQFRVRQRLTQPFCPMEPVECEPYQDTCVTITQQLAPGRFWVGSGCDQRVNYDYPSDRDGCTDMDTFTRSYQLGFMEERTVVQRVCLCTGNLCNAASPGSRHCLQPWTSVVLTLIILLTSRRIAR